MNEDRPTLWGIVLAGGEGERLRAFVQAHLGTNVPKQFCALWGRRTMLERTMRRASLIIPSERLVVVGTVHHSPHLLRNLTDWPCARIVLQPANRGTGLGILLPLVHILRQDPRALIVILPSDQWVLPGRRFMRAVAEAADFLTETNTDAHVLLAVDPTDPEPEYGWIEPGSAAMPEGRWAVQCINRFIEKPSGEHARLLMTRGWLWNTMVLVARADSLFRLTQEVAPEMAAYFSMIQNAIGTHWEQGAVNDVYRMMPSIDFSSAILAKRPEQLVTLPVRNVWWSDWGRAERIHETLARFGASLPATVHASAHVESTSRTAIAL